ncbi:unnamed protein product [Psylliodes chrysocephalus]|uniref:Uncharacterized protein n=1 Tax=Psylliodes chrysocephalus TaxID=3402493 RepID=A0A9P0CKI4_9CUCU|nr:unnamed protein product [Psylliodes chrysocephala]
MLNDLLKTATTFLHHDATFEKIASAGSKCFVELCGEEESDSLHALLYGTFVIFSANVKVHHARLPPKRRGCCSIFLQWLGADKKPTNWRWRRSQQDLTPVCLNQGNSSANSAEIPVT